MEELKPEDADGGFLSREGRVMEMLSEHTLEGWLEGYLLTGRHGFFSSYEAFVHIIDSMFNQHAKWLEKSKLELRWRAPISSLNLLITSLVWRQDHNGFTHQDPGFLDIVTNKSPEVVRIYLPPDANCLLSVTDHCLCSTNYVNVIVADKAPHLQYLTMDEAIDHCTKGIGIWDFASNDDGAGAGCGDGVRGRHSYFGVTGGGGDTAGAVPGPEDPIRQRGGSVPADAGERASTRGERQGV
jgi:xylulose-5-phosphate/fructose-6-phosphate phosphoketolase